MEMTGEQLVPAPQRVVWEALNDPAMLKASVPGCEAIDPIGENQYQVLMVACVGPVSAKFKGKLTLSDVKPPESYSIAFEGQGGAAPSGKCCQDGGDGGDGGGRGGLAVDGHHGTPWVEWGPA